MEADIQYDGEGDNIYTGGKDQEQWAGKCQQCPDFQNRNIIFDGPVSISCRGVAKKEASQPAYQTQNIGSGDGILPSVLGTVFQQRTAAAVVASRHNGEGVNMGVSKNIK